MQRHIDEAKTTRCVVSFPILIMAAVAVEASTIDVCGWKKHRARKEQDPFLQWPQRPYGLLLPSFLWLIITSFRSSYFFTSSTLLPWSVTDNPLISESVVSVLFFITQFHKSVQHLATVVGLISKASRISFLTAS